MAFTASESTHGRWDLDPEWPSHPPASPSSWSQPRIDIQLDITKPIPGPEGPWLHEIAVQARLNGTCVAKCAAALIKEDVYKPVNRHFFSAMDLQSNALGDLAQLYLWQEGRWGTTLRRLSEGGKKAARSHFERDQWEGRTTHSMIQKYCYPVLFKPRPGTTDSYPFPGKTTWMVYFAAIKVAEPYRRAGIARAMVTKVLEQIRTIAKKARRQLLAAVEPGTMYSELPVNLAQHRYRRPWTAGEQQFWLSMGFQKFNKPYKLPAAQMDGPDTSNWHFWSGNFDLPKTRVICLQGPRKLLIRSTPPKISVSSSGQRPDSRASPGGKSKVMLDMSSKQSPGVPEESEIRDDNVEMAQEDGVTIDVAQKDDDDDDDWMPGEEEEDTDEWMHGMYDQPQT